MQAERDAQIALAEGKAKSIELVYEAEAQGLERLNQAQPTDQILRVKSIEAIKDIANGNSTKVFIPSSIMDSVGDNIGNMSVMAEAFDLKNQQEINKKPKQVKVDVDPCIKPTSSETTKEVHVKQAIQKEEVEADFDNMDFKY